MTLRELYLSQPAPYQRVTRTTWRSKYDYDVSFPFYTLKVKVAVGSLSIDSVIADDWEVVPESDVEDGETE